MQTGHQPGLPICRAKFVTRNKCLPPHPNTIDAAIGIATGVMTDRGSGDSPHTDTIDSGHTSSACFANCSNQALWLLNGGKRHGLRNRGQGQSKCDGG